MIEDDSKVLAPPKMISQLVIAPGFCVQFAHRRPGVWVRFWAWALLGWRWEVIK